MLAKFNRVLLTSYTEAVMQTLMSALILGSENGAQRFHDLLVRLTPLERRKVVSALLHLLSHKYLGSTGPGEADTASSQAKVAAVAELIHRLVDTDALVSEGLENWLVSSSGAVTVEGVAIRRAVMAVVAQHKDILISVLEKAMDQFSDPLYIKHTPVLHQEGMSALFPQHTRLDIPLTLAKPKHRSCSSRQDTSTDSRPSSL